MGERLLCKQEVIGSIPFTSTTLKGRRQKDEEGDRRLIQISERSQVSPEAYFWSFDRRGCSLFNNSEEASASISQDRCMGCDCIDLIPSQSDGVRHKRENSCSQDFDLDENVRPEASRL